MSEKKKKLRRSARPERASRRPAAPGRAARCTAAYDESLQQSRQGNHAYFFLILPKQRPNMVSLCRAPKKRAYNMAPLFGAPIWRPYSAPIRYPMWRP